MSKGDSMKLQKMCENIRDLEPGTIEHERACLKLAEYLGVSIWVGQYVGDKVNDDFALIILRALEGREEEEDEHENKLIQTSGLKVKS